MNHLFDFTAKANRETVVFSPNGITQKTGNVKEKMPLSLASFVTCFLCGHKKGTEEVYSVPFWEGPFSVNF